MKWAAIILASLAVLAAIGAGAIYASSDEVCTETRVDEENWFGPDSRTTRRCHREWPWE